MYTLHQAQADRMTAIVPDVTQRMTRPRGQLRERALQISIAIGMPKPKMTIVRSVVRNGVCAMIAAKTAKIAMRMRVCDSITNIWTSSGQSRFSREMYD